MSHQRVLVLGGAGFLGSHLCERLLGDGHEVFALDNLTTGSRDNLAALEGRPGFTFIEHDVTKPFFAPVSRIYNLACPASPPHYQRDPIHTTLTSVLGTLHALRLAKACDARVLFASTSEIYGDPEVHPQPESYRGWVNPIGPRACYDEGKRCGESLMMDFSRKEGLEVRIARIFNTYGPRMHPHDGRIVSNFVTQALDRRPITIYGDGSQTRSLCFVSDLIDGLERLMNHPTLTGPVNLGSTDERSVLEIAQIVLALTGARTRIVHRPLPVDDPRLRRPNLELARSTLGYVPRIDLEQGLRTTIAHFASLGRGGRAGRAVAKAVESRRADELAANGASR